MTMETPGNTTTATKNQITFVATMHTHSKTNDNECTAMLEKMQRKIGHAYERLPSQVS